MAENTRAGRLMVLGFDGAQAPPELLGFAARFGLGGVILFRRNCPDADTVAALVRDTKARLAEADPGGHPLVFVDQEGGRVQRIQDWVPLLPPAQELGKRGEQGVEEAARLQAVGLAQLGIDVNLAPVCDVLQEGESGDIGDRSFGQDPEGVARLVSAFVRGSRAGGIACCAKHFPGLGAAKVNSHKGLPVVEKTCADLEAADLLPFGSAIESGVSLVMPGHVVYPDVSPWPASLSPEWIRGVLRDRLGFRGAVISDDMEMGALRELATPEAAALRAVEAGCDLLIFSRMLRSDVDLWAVASSLETGLASPVARRACELVSHIHADPLHRA